MQHLEHTLPQMPEQILSAENISSSKLDWEHPQSHRVHSIFVSLLPLEELRSHTGAAVIVENIRCILWDTLVE